MRVNPNVSQQIGPLLFTGAYTKINLQAIIASAGAFNAKVTAREVHGRSLSTPRLPCLCSRRMGSRTFRIMDTKSMTTLQGKDGLPSMAEKEYKQDPLSLMMSTINSMHSSLQVQLRLAHGHVGRTQASPGPTQPTLLIYQIAVKQNKTISHPSRRLLEILTSPSIVQWRR